ncbi:MAG: cyclic nucleotide-binding domain-containing protein [Pseudomonadota bacterium]
MSLIEQLPADAFGYFAALLVFATFCMKTMPALRMIAVLSNLVFLAYGWAADLMPVMVLHGALLPLNLARLADLRHALRRAEEAAKEPADAADFSWLVPFAQARRLPAGALLFERGEEAHSLFVLVKGKVELPEVGVVLQPGAMFGEVALFSADRTRTASALAQSDVEVAELSERRVQQLYFDNPRFAYRLIRMITGRLVENAQRWEAEARSREAEAEAEAA